MVERIEELPMQTQKRKNGNPFAKNKKKRATENKNRNKYKNQSRRDDLLCLFNTFASFYGFFVWSKKVLSICLNEFE